MRNSNWNKDRSVKAKKIWEDYLKQHDLSNRAGETAGIDPESGRIWFGESIRDVVSKRNKDGFSSPLFFERVGSETYYHI